MSKFKVISGYTGAEDPQEFEAYDFKDAAEQYAEWEDVQSAEYTIAEGRPEIVTVTDSSGWSRTFSVNGHTKVVYRATELVSKS